MDWDKIHICDRSLRMKRIGIVIFVSPYSNRAEMNVLFCSLETVQYRSQSLKRWPRSSRLRVEGACLIGWPRSWPSPDRFAPGPRGRQEQSNLNPTTFQHASEDRKSGRYWTLPRNLGAFNCGVSAELVETRRANKRKCNTFSIQRLTYRDVNPC